MALILLIVIGASAGWMASIIARAEAPGAVLRQMALGVLAALIAGLLTNSGTFLGGLSLVALGAAIAAAALVLLGYNFYFHRTSDA